jgi:hypothetical protein
MYSATHDLSSDCYGNTLPTPVDGPWPYNTLYFSTITIPVWKVDCLLMTSFQRLNGNTNDSWISTSGAAQVMSSTRLFPMARNSPSGDPDRNAATMWAFPIRSTQLLFAWSSIQSRVSLQHNLMCSSMIGLPPLPHPSIHFLISTWMNGYACVS